MALPAQRMVPFSGARHPGEVRTASAGTACPSRAGYPGLPKTVPRSCCRTRLLWARLLPLLPQVNRRLGSPRLATFGLQALQPPWDRHPRELATEAAHGPLRHVPRHCLARPFLRKGSIPSDKRSCTTPCPRPHLPDGNTKASPLGLGPQSLRSAGGEVRAYGNLPFTRPSA